MAGLEPAHTSRRGALPTELHLRVPRLRIRPELSGPRILSNARFNAGKSNGPSRSHALLTGHNARQVRACRNIAPVRCQLWVLVQTAGLEPATFSLFVKRSCLLSYVCMLRGRREKIKSTAPRYGAGGKRHK